TEQRFLFARIDVSRARAFEARPPCRTCASTNRARSNISETVRSICAESARDGARPRARHSSLEVEADQQGVRASGKRASCCSARFGVMSDRTVYGLKSRSVRGYQQSSRACSPRSLGRRRRKIVPTSPGLEDLPALTDVHVRRFPCLPHP